ncbi:DUF551 domain-containing protein [Escherichia coli]|nr:DUF551 domain-containing protein [Escherichia coli]
MSTITRERAEIKSYITGFLSDSAHDNKSSDSLLANVFRIALASLEAEPIAMVVPDEMDLLTCHLDGVTKTYADGWNACRAAMLHSAEPVSQAYKLNALDGNSPVTPDGWISCSERMPDTKTAVLVAVEFDRKGDWRMKWATYIPGHPDANDGWIIPGASWKPSHWMPLPEPPQEVNRG